MFTKVPAESAQVNLNNFREHSLSIIFLIFRNPFFSIKKNVVRWGGNFDGVFDCAFSPNKRSPAVIAGFEFATRCQQDVSDGVCTL